MAIAAIEVKGSFKLNVVPAADAQTPNWSKRPLGRPENPIIVGVDDTDANGSPLKRQRNGARMMWFADPHEKTGPGTEPGDNPYHHMVPHALRFHPPGKRQKQPMRSRMLRS